MAAFDSEGKPDERAKGRSPRTPGWQIATRPRQPEEPRGGNGDGPEEFSVALQPNGSWTLVKVGGELDMLTAPRLSAALAAQTGSSGDLLIDLSELFFIDSSGIHVLVGACAQNGTRVICPPGGIRRVLDIVSFSKVARLHETLEEALASRQTG